WSLVSSVKDRCGAPRGPHACTTCPVPPSPRAPAAAGS
ncbi:MAG: hypothetical protein AVDCRST_MAG37-1650, partial [uncultured Rubrobacteraceae bacterium]